MFKNSLAETLTETERAFQMSFVAMTDAIVIAIQIVSYVVIVIIMVVAANTMAMTARERISEYATMKTLGFGARHIAGAVFGESIAIALIGGMMGVVLPSCGAGSSRIETVLSRVFDLGYDDSRLVGCICCRAMPPCSDGQATIIAEGLRRIG
jgi:putative ABC transport system permease protein